MEVSTKERLTGALIVVLALIVIAPEMLSGRRAADHSTPPAQNPEDGAPLQTYSIQLDAARTAPVASRDAPAAAPAEIAAGQPPLTEEAPPPATTPATAPKPASADRSPRGNQPSKAGAPAKTSATPAAGKWWVQVGSFASRDNAQRVAQQLRDTGYAMEVSRTRQNGTDLYRVRAGPVADREAAAALLARLVAAGEKDSRLVAP